MPKSVKIPVINCKNCPHCDTKLTKGYGYALDYFCTKATKIDDEYRTIAGYVEWPSEEPQDNKIPLWCPFTRSKKSA